ncbi:DEAD box ATP-dependent RNA helicase [Encephalitozoon intestinalis ATCC 50506]|uniref:ATP-dependent RNA helicase n=1 Tax=Encephalitozoon intestinalis (strain ATCC 50506) TaxID=876142 RepID=E0S9V4_ENCIT|nr:DEAD box ATP-dependent RNA helicase [Encephalitozoon intestinalis ATCC 50506]ADM12489.1 DEAD box ATP-dependent RNA helicase [Encephalitozoon intestinalis ATCC 50506]UTX46326.1 RNA helicase [Encephalitozoon intestinalis]
MKFEDLKIDQRIEKGLRESGFVDMKEIQQKVIPMALEGHDIIGSSQTGTGKTLAFLVPILQKLTDLQWSGGDGLGCVIITPTRELALQIFDVLSKVGKYTVLSTGLIMGGLETENESLRLSNMNILVCTPGRFLQHLQENPYLNTGGIQILVLDEADKMIEMGFKETLEDILGYIPSKKQTLLFSATPKASTARILRLEDPKIVSMYKEEGFPSQLHQYFYMMRMEDKVNYLHTFIGSNPGVKGIVFFSTCKEVKFHYLLFEKLKLRNRIFCLSGGMSQKQRIDTFKKFVREKNGILFCTDLGSRGLDFPKVDVVIQYDCPCNIETYVHRVGRTARNNEGGESYVYLVYGEEKLLGDIQKKGWIKKQETESKDEEDRGSSEEIVEGPNIRIKSIDRMIKGLIKSNKELNEYCRKYLTTYEKFLTFSSKRYSESIIRKISILYEYFGISKD